MELTLLDINKLIESEEDIIKSTTSCFQYQPVSGNYNFYIFISEFENGEELLSNYKVINDTIAFDFQTKLINNFEKWNLYHFYLVKNRVDSDVREVVEQDKYATRKLVFEVNSDNLSIDYKKNLIFKKLFNLNISNKIVGKSPDLNGLKNLVIRIDPELVETIDNVRNIKSKNSRELKLKRSKLIQSYLEMEIYE